MIEKRYEVKTRNWFCERRLLRLLEVIPHERGDSYTDGDAKLYFQTDSLILALAVWVYWRVLAHWSGGWTYVRDNKKYPEGLANKGLLHLNAFFF